MPPVEAIYNILHKCLVAIAVGIGYGVKFVLVALATECCEEHKSTVGNF